MLTDQAYPRRQQQSWQQRPLLRKYGISKKIWVRIRRLFYIWDI